MSSVRIKTLLNIKYKQEKITIQRKGSDKFESLSVKDFRELFHVDYLYGVVCKKRDIKKLNQCIKELKKTGECKNENEKLAGYFANPQQYFNMVYLNDRCGYVLIANRDIPDTVVGIYSGKLIIKDGSEETEYMMNVMITLKWEIKLWFKYLRGNGDLTQFAPHCQTIQAFRR